MVKPTLDDKCKKALIEVTQNLKKIKQKLRQIEGIEKDIDKKTSYILETLSVENIIREYSGLRNFFDESGYEREEY